MSVERERLRNVVVEAARKLNMVDAALFHERCASDVVTGRLEKLQSDHAGAVNEVCNAAYALQDYDEVVPRKGR